jgi:hypothetical protein
MAKFMELHIEPFYFTKVVEREIKNKSQLNFSALADKR